MGRGDGGQTKGEGHEVADETAGQGSLFGNGARSGGDYDSVSCLDLGLFGPDAKQALGIPRSVTGKNPLFDRQA
jgi:hypothetical protein